MRRLNPADDYLSIGVRRDLRRHTIGRNINIGQRKEEAKKKVC